MMNADVTAENRPACGPSQNTRGRTVCTTHEYESGIQIFVVLLHEFFVVILGFLSVFCVEPSARIVLG